MKLLLSCFLLVAVSSFGAVPDYKAFRGTGGIIITTNPPNGTIVIDGSGVPGGSATNAQPPSAALTNAAARGVLTLSNANVGFLSSAGVYTDKVAGKLQVDGGIQSGDGFASTDLGWGIGAFHTTDPSRALFYSRGPSGSSWIWGNGAGTAAATDWGIYNGSESLDSYITINTLGNIGIGTVTPAKQFTYNFSGAATNSTNQGIYITGVARAVGTKRLIDIDVTTDYSGDLYGILSHPRIGLTNSGSVIGLEGWLSETPHRADQGGYYAGVIGHVQSPDAGFTYTANYGVMGIARGADYNACFYGVIGAAVFNDWIAIGQYDRESDAGGEADLRGRAIMPRYPFDFLDWQTITNASESATNISVYLGRRKSGQGTNSENGTLLFLHRDITNTSGTNGLFIMASNNANNVMYLGHRGNMWLGGPLTMGALSGSPSITTDTADGADNKLLTVTGGGGNSVGRGALIELYGNEQASTPGDIGIYGGNVAGGDISLLTTPYGAPQTVMLKATSGNFGIGTATPAAKLDVAGAGNFSSLMSTNAITLGTTNWATISSPSQGVIQLREDDFGFKRLVTEYIGFAATNRHLKIVPANGALTGATNALWFQGENNFTQATNAFINQQSGKVNLTLGHAFYYITNNLVTTNSILLATLNSTPDSERLVAAVPLNGVIRLEMSAAWSTLAGGNISWFIVSP